MPHVKRMIFGVAVPSVVNMRNDVLVPLKKETFGGKDNRCARGVHQEGHPSFACAQEKRSNDGLVPRVTKEILEEINETHF